MHSLIAFEDALQVPFHHRADLCLNVCLAAVRHVYRAGIGVPVLKMTASARAFQRCVARAHILTACVVMAYRGMAQVLFHHRADLCWNMCMNMCADMCVGMCIDMVYGPVCTHVYGRAYRYVHSHVCSHVYKNVDRHA